jgi:hypothetical protein
VKWGKYHESGEWVKACRGCGKEMVFKYYCIAKVRRYCSRQCQGRRTIRNQYGVHVPWSKAEDRVLLEEFPDCPSPWKLAKRLGRPYAAVMRRAEQLGLEKSKAAIEEASRIGGRMNKGRPRPDFVKNGFRGSGPDNPFYGKTHSAETRAFISKSQKEKSAFLRLNSDPDFQAKRLVAYRKATDNPEFRRRQLKAVVDSQGGPNKAERKLDALLQRLFPGEYKYTGDGTLIIDRMNPDFANVNGQKKLIELFGEHVHHTKKAFCKVSKRRTYRGRKRAFAEFGYKALIVWSAELKDEWSLVKKLRAFHEDRCD